LYQEQERPFCEFSDETCGAYAGSTQRQKTKRPKDPAQPNPVRLLATIFLFLPWADAKKTNEGPLVKRPLARSYSEASHRLENQLENKLALAQCRATMVCDGGLCFSKIRVVQEADRVRKVWMVEQVEQFAAELQA